MLREEAADVFGAAKMSSTIPLGAFSLVLDATGTAMMAPARRTTRPQTCERVVLFEIDDTHIERVEQIVGIP
jgi:hypothetical protein